MWQSIGCNTSLCCVKLLTYDSHKCTNNFQEIPYSILLMVTYYVPLPSILAFECTFAIPPGRRLLRLLWPFMGGSSFLLSAWYHYFNFAPLFTRLQQEGIKKRVLLPYRAGFLSRLRHHPSRKYDFLHLKCLFAKVTTSYRCAHCRTYLKRCYFHCYHILAIS